MTRRAVSRLMRLGVGVTLITVISAAVVAAGLSLSGLAVPVAGASGTNASGTVITSSANPAAYQTAVTLTATVTGTSELGAPTGTVAFTNGSDTPLTCGAGSDSTLTPISSSASTATCLYTPPATGGVGGTFSTRGTYSGDSTYATSPGSLAQEVLGNLATVGANVFSANPSPNGIPVTMNDTLTDPSRTANPASAAGAFPATVTVFVQGTSTVLCANVVLSPTGTYTASFSCKFTPSGPGQTLLLRTVYSGNATFAASSGSSTLVVAGTASTTPSVVASPTTLALGASTTLQATLTGSPAPTGNVTFLDDGTPVAGCGRIVEQSGVAQSKCAYAPAAAGSHSITVTYSGDTTYAAAGPSAAATVIVTGTATPAPPPTTSPSTSTSHGYWLVGSDGGIFSFGSAQFYGSMGGIALAAPRGRHRADPRPRGLLARRLRRRGLLLRRHPVLRLDPGPRAQPGRLGQAQQPQRTDRRHGAEPRPGRLLHGGLRRRGLRLRRRPLRRVAVPGIGGCSGAAVAVMPDASGNGYWLVTATGNVYTFGDAPNLGAPGTPVLAHHLGGGHPRRRRLLHPRRRRPGLLLRRRQRASAACRPGATGGLNPASAIFVTSDNGGYWVSDALGDVYTFGDAPNDGSMAGTHLNGSIIAASGS